ncbi:hypothetical protein GQ57_34540 [Burkholderia sp. MSh2]|uniref:Uncharacterized protein n=1 Tax=Burkholderia paludis TaxID=1506587 RepID=A0A6P2RIU0_9BURK|nr:MULTISPECIES: hypothetical protein [Burkholderia]KEZ01523.1 hypothetical protein GQ57_34540 [Burkholderia sp. MSh2]CAB3768741.1 hypothetical protein LMG30113_05804 [Burkholderia paludis]VWC33145.1 hypothetical protein BPA30113_06413 [Burkholderia paludis]
MTATKKRKTVTRHVKHASTTGTDQKSLVKAVIQSDIGEWVHPKTGDKFYIDETTRFPSVTFEIETNDPPPYQWKWSIVWDAQVSSLRESAKRGKKVRSFSETGSFTSNDTTWDAKLNDKIIGGKLSVEVKAGTTDFRRTVFILGKNPAKDDVLNYLKAIPNTAGFDLILEQESRFKNFINADNEPVVAGDRGYGITQMTNPAPSYEQVWNWKENIKAGVALWQLKQKAAIASFDGVPYTEEQLRRETFTRWNGGSYYKANTKTQTLERRDIQCDTQTGNIGWDMKDPTNIGKTEAELHDRDKDEYKKMKGGQGKDHRWMYSGICYVDHIFGR